ncbi:aromatic ring-hydroxylating dioxygenase subunit alpha [Novosphingobium profundi]|uniref:aromatic ring-hydroxylating oxygenase subunit alpha n=1 Tax=Novosphingobium profundi TaxID=1774954 RepID=UPI001BDA483A|nr:aromatic ring-hydroxylating dioxygenase subunit alpha [Novosphingobium profundi]MBT0668149.1 aromatic ring-hydroxylating dioxygenase subunit alpha [Novosphingobium profundi]
MTVPVASIASERLNSGLREMWYPVAPSWMLQNAPLGLTRLSQRIVLWRDAEGKVNAIDDRCPHRGARLSMGWNLGDRVACWYHGVEVNGEGRIEDIPALAKCVMKGRPLNRAFPAVERAGAIFVWFGEGEPTALELPEEISGGEWADILCTAHWKCNWRYAVDNVMDPMHGAYLHAQSHSMAEGDKTATMRARDTDAGFVFEKTNQSGVNFDWTEVGLTGALWLRLSIPYGKSAGPGGSFGIVGMVVPVDETSCRVFFWRCRKVSGWARNAWKFLYRARLESLHWDVLEQDRLILEGMDDRAREQEALYAHDGGIVRLRRMLEQLASAEVAAASAKTAGAREQA